MKIKHTFLLTLALGLAWSGYLFAYVLGPDPAMNGVFGSAQTCASAGCHTGNSVNAAGGSITLSGLPSTWTPGQTYALSVSVARTNARVFGFQLSAVGDASSQQAGTLTAGNGRVQIMCGRGTAGTSTQPTSCSTAGAIQYAQHADARVVTTSFLVNWTAPASAGFGTVRFNVAGNAANGDVSNQGDFIYTATSRVDPASAAPPPDLSTRAFTMVDRGGSSVITDGSGALTVGYSRILPASGSTTPTGVAIFGLRQNGTLVTEAGVPASPTMTSARIYAELGGAVNTGVAIANPNSSAATLSFHFTDAAGVDFGSGTKVMSANGQFAAFIDQDPFFGLAGGRTSIRGTLSITSDLPISIVALRGFASERLPSEFLITTLPVTNVSATPASGTVYLPHFAEGGGWTTQIVLVNPTDSALTGSIQFFSQGDVNAGAAGVPVTLTANGQAAANFAYTIPRQSSFKLVTSGALPDVAVGSVRVTPATGASPSSQVIFSYKPGAITVSEAGVPGIQGTAFRMYAEETAMGGVGSIQTGFAIANLGPSSVVVDLSLTRLDGTSAGDSSVRISGNGQAVGFLHDFFPTSILPFQGIMRISGGAAAGMSVVGLRTRYNERSDFLITTAPPSDENRAASSAELLFPHVVNGGGYTTQFILFSGSSAQASSGNLRFLTQAGAAFNLIVN